MKPRNEQVERVARQLYEAFRAVAGRDRMGDWDALVADKSKGWKLVHKAWVAVAEATVFHHM